MRCRTLEFDRRAPSLARGRNWSFDRRRGDRRVIEVRVTKERRSGVERRSGHERRRDDDPKLQGASSSQTPITTWLTRRLPDDFLARSGDAAERIWGIVGKHWPRYEMSSQAELVRALTPVLRDLLNSGQMVTEEHRKRCEMEIVSWLSRHSPKTAQHSTRTLPMRVAV